MQLIPEKTQLESDLAQKDASILRSAEAVHHAATVIMNENRLFWSLPTDRLLGVLNHNVARTLATFAANTAAATAINGLLDAVGAPHLANRIPNVPGRSDIVLQDGVFVYVAPVVEEPEPDGSLDDQTENEG
jgi:hypothetical protein